MRMKIGLELLQQLAFCRVPMSSHSHRSFNRLQQIRKTSLHILTTKKETTTTLLRPLDVKQKRRRKKKRRNEATTAATTIGSGHRWRTSVLETDKVDTQELIQNVDWEKQNNWFFCVCSTSRLGQQQRTSREEAEGGIVCFSWTSINLIAFHFTYEREGRERKRKKKKRKKKKKEILQHLFIQRWRF